MTTNIFKRQPRSPNILLMSLVSIITACVDEPDESNRYTFTGESIESYILKDTSLTSFNYILKRARQAEKLSAYGQYTCFAPTNSGVAIYIDSLYDDPEAAIPHNGMSSKSLEGLSDSLCRDIALYHLANSALSTLSIGSSNATIPTMLGRNMSATTNSNGNIVLNRHAEILAEDADKKMTNGYLHVLQNVIPRTTRTFADTFDRLEDFTIFAQALRATGFSEKINELKKDRSYTIAGHSDTDGSPLYWPAECKLGYTIFAESDKVMQANGINNLDDLVAFANNTYKNATEWYDLMRDRGMTVSTGTDYTKPNNALNMFVAYHIIKAAMAQDQLVFEKKEGVSCAVSKWNYVNGGEPYEYHTTMLENTMMKIWEPYQGKTLYINRYQTFNTLTDEVGTMGSKAMHKVEREGVVVERTDIHTINGYIHPINDMLVYDRLVPYGVLHERLRLETTTFLTEFINNGFKYMSIPEVSNLNNGGSGARIAFPIDYFDDVKCHTTTSELRYNVKGDYRLYQADTFQGWGYYDVCIKLPAVPLNGLYELRFDYSPVQHGGMMQFYLGESYNPQEMTALGIPFDIRIQEDDPRIGWTPFYEEDDQGIATDEAMRNRGYMRGPVSFRGHPDGTGDMMANNARGDGVTLLRRILGRVEMKQGINYWFRIKNMIKDETELKWGLDFIELVPVDVVDNEQYSEDWF